MIIHHIEAIRNAELTSELLTRRIEAARLAVEAGWTVRRERLVQARQIARQLVEDLDLLMEHGE